MRFLLKVNIPVKKGNKAAKGKVIDINLRYVTLKTESGSTLIPNANFLTSVIRREPSETS